MTAAAPEVTDELEELLNRPPTCNIRHKPSSTEFCGRPALWLAVLPCRCRAGSLFACQECKEHTNALLRKYPGVAGCLFCGTPVRSITWTPL